MHARHMALWCVWSAVSDGARQGARGMSASHCAQLASMWRSEATREHGCGGRQRASPGPPNAAVVLFVLAVRADILAW